MELNSEIILQILSILIMLGSCVLHFCNHYKCRNCCCPRPQPHHALQRTLSSHRGSIRTSVLIYNNRGSNNCCCCQIDVTCGALSCIVPRNEDLQCYPLLFLCYLIFCILISIFTSYILYTKHDIILSDIPMYLMIASIILELLLNYYKYSTTIECIKTLSNTEESYTLYCYILMRIIVYGALVMILFHLLIIIQYNTLLLTVIWWILFAFIVLIHCVLNSYFILGFTNILIEQYNAITEMEPNLIEIINDSMIKAVMSMRRYSLCAITISTIYLIILLICNKYDKNNIINIMRYYPCFWCFICCIFCLNFAKNREWIKEKLLYFKLKIQTIHKQNKHNHMNRSISLQNNTKNVIHIHELNIEINNETKEEEDDIDERESTSQTLLTSISSDTPHSTPMIKHLPPKPVKITKSRSDIRDVVIGKSPKHKENGLQRSSTDRNNNTNMPFSMVVQQYKDITEQSSLLRDINKNSPSPSNESFNIIPKKLRTSRSARDATRNIHCHDNLYKSISFPRRMKSNNVYTLSDLNDRESTESIENYNGIDDFKTMIAAISSKTRKKPNILRSQTDIDGYYGDDDMFDENDEELNELKKSFKSTKSTSEANIYGIKSADFIYKKIKRRGFKALELLGISCNTEHTPSPQEDDIESDEDDDIDIDKFKMMLDFDNDNNMVWIDDDDDDEIDDNNDNKMVLNIDNINIENDIDISVENMSGSDDTVSDKPLCFTPLDSLHMLQRNSTKMSRAASYDLGAMDNELKKQFGDVDMIRMSKTKSSKSIKSIKSFESDDNNARSMSDLRIRKGLQKELHKINEMNEENIANHDMDDMVNLMYLMVKQGLYTSKNFNSVKQISKYNQNNVL